MTENVRKLLFTPNRQNSPKTFTNKSNPSTLSNNEFTNLRFALCILIAASVTGAYTLLSLRATMFTPLLETKQYEQAVLDALDLGNKLPPFGVINPVQTE